METTSRNSSKGLKLFFFSAHFPARGWKLWNAASAKAYCDKKAFPLISPQGDGNFLRRPTSISLTPSFPLISPQGDGNEADTRFFTHPFYSFPLISPQGDGNLKLLQITVRCLGNLFRSFPRKGMETKVKASSR